MHVAFRRLFRIRVRHGWYMTGEVRGDFAVVPTPSTAELLEALAFRVRVESDGLSAYAEVNPGSEPPTLVRDLGDIALRFAFELRVVNRQLVSIAELPGHAPGRTVFCFDNLRQDVASSRKHLGDSIANARVGPAVTLVTRATYLYHFGAPVAGALLMVTNRFGATVMTLPVTSADGSTSLTECAVDLSNLAFGRYTIADDRGSSARIYYDRGLEASRPFGVIEVYDRTDPLTPDGTNRVPAGYRFLSESTVLGLDGYHVQLEPLATTWRYIVTKKYTGNDITLEKLSIEGPISFGRRLEGERAVFTSNSRVPLSEGRQGLRLTHDHELVRNLPDPQLDIPLGKGTSPGTFTSDVFVYV